MTRREQQEVEAKSFQTTVGEHKESSAGFRGWLQTYSRAQSHWWEVQLIHTPVWVC